MKSITDAVKKTQAAFKKIQSASKTVVATEAKNHFKQSWRQQGFEDRTVEKWPEVKRRIKGTEAYKNASRAARRRAILVETGALRRSVKVIRRNWPVVVGTRGISYARKHNDGAGNLPKRQFIGYSRKLEKRTLKQITRIIHNELK